MKTTIIFCFLLIAVAFAHIGDERHRPEIEKLMKEANQLLAKANAVIDKFNSNVNDYLLPTLRYEVVFVKTLVKDLETYHNEKDDVISEDQLHKFEEELKYREGRINDEIQALEQINKKDYDGWTKVAVLIKHCDELVQRAREFLKKHPSADKRAVDALEYEIQQVNELSQKLGKRASELKPYTLREEEELDKHEISIAKLMERIEHPHFDIMADPDHYVY